MEAAEGGSTSMAVRNLCEGVFTDAALSQCSLTGMPPRGKGREVYQDPSKIKPFINQKAIGEIIRKFCISVLLEYGTTA